MFLKRNERLEGKGNVFEKEQKIKRLRRLAEKKELTYENENM